MHWECYSTEYPSLLDQLFWEHWSLQGEEIGENCLLPLLPVEYSMRKTPFREEVWNLLSVSEQLSSFCFKRKTYLPPPSIYDYPRSLGYFTNLFKHFFSSWKTFWNLWGNNSLLFTVHTKVFYFIKWDSLIFRRALIRRLVALKEKETNYDTEVVRQHLFI